MGLSKTLPFQDILIWVIFGMAWTNSWMLSWRIRIVTAPPRILRRWFDWFFGSWFSRRYRSLSEIRSVIEILVLSPRLPRWPPGCWSRSGIGARWTPRVVSIRLYTFAGYGRLYTRAMIWRRTYEAAPLLLLCHRILLSTRSITCPLLHHFDRERIRYIILLVHSSGHRIVAPSLLVFGLGWCPPAILLRFGRWLIGSTNSSILSCAISLFVKIWLHHILV